MTHEQLKGIRVIELASVLAGPSVGMFLAELGAEVIKVENPRTGGDVTRQWKLPTENDHGNVSAYFCSVNYGKQYQSADLKTDEGKQQVYELVKTADIVLTNFKPGDDVKLAMDYHTLKGFKEDIIVGHITGFGDDNPRAAFDVVVQAEAGYMFMNGTPETDPLKMPMAFMDILSAHQLKEGLLLALLRREKTGLGSYVTASLFEAGLSALTNQATNWLMCGHIPQRTGSLHPNIAPYGEVLHTADGRSIVLAVGSDHQFSELCRILGCPELVTDPRFNNNQERVVNRTVMLEALQQHAQTHQRDELLEQLLEAKVPAGAIYNMQEVFENPQAKAMVREETIENIPTSRTSSVGFRMQ